MRAGGPVVGDYVASRLLDRDREPDLAEGFSLPLEQPAETTSRRG
jgi:hypothetical protein